VPGDRNRHGVRRMIREETGREEERQGSRKIQSTRTIEIRRLSPRVERSIPLMGPSLASEVRAGVPKEGDLLEGTRVLIDGIMVLIEGTKVLIEEIMALIDVTMALTVGTMGLIAETRGRIVETMGLIDETAVMLMDLREMGDDVTARMIAKTGTGILQAEIAIGIRQAVAIVGTPQAVDSIETVAVAEMETTRQDLMLRHRSGIGPGHLESLKTEAVGSKGHALVMEKMLSTRQKTIQRILLNEKTSRQVKRGRVQHHHSTILRVRQGRDHRRPQCAASQSKRRMLPKGVKQ